jgi:protein-tyrosine phosphatase
MVNVLFVCLGNICRSPMAEALFNHKLKDRGLADRITGESAGTAHWHIGDPPDPRTIEVVEKNGIKIQHRGRQITGGEIEKYDWILAMDAENYRDIMKLVDPKPVKVSVRMMREFDRERSGKNVPDPYYGDEDDFEEVFEMLSESCGILIDHLVQTYGYTP